MPKHKGPAESIPTENLIWLAHEGYRFARLLKNGREYVGLPGKFRATHKIKCHRVEPRYLKKDVPPGVVWLELSKNSAPTSAVAIPRGRAYKNFVAQRTEAARDGSLYDKNPRKGNATMASKKAPATKTSNRVVKNDVTLPAEGTTCRKVFDICDKHDGERAAVLKECDQRKINRATATTQYGKWRAFNGIVGTAKKAAKPVKKKPAPPAKKKVAPVAPVAAAE